ncbi:MAG: DUF4349 domain-containing protein, partial [Eubacteriales bacterium]
DLGYGSGEDIKSDFEAETGKAPSYVDDSYLYEQKIIKTYEISLEAKDYDSAKDKIMTSAKIFGGYISESLENDSSSGKRRYSSYTVRIPSDKVDEYVNSISENASVISKRLYTDDITTSYYDIKSEIESLTEQETRIRELITMATDLDSLIKLEDKLAQVRAEINSLSKKLEYYDKSVALSFVYVRLSEVEEYTPIKAPTFGERIKNAFAGTFKGFADFLKDVFVGIIWLLPVIIIAAIVIPVIILIIKNYERKRREKYERYKESKNTEDKSSQNNKTNDQ